MIVGVIQLFEFFRIFPALAHNFFKKVTGTTSAAYISELRIKKSLPLIENTDLGMAEIAEKVGFDDPNYFSRVFRSVTGITPSEYRKGVEKESY